MSTHYYENFDIEPLEGEEFRDIKGFEGKYQISNFGRLKSLARGTRDEIICKLKHTKNGYVYALLSVSGKNKDYKFKSIGVSRLVALTFIENPDPSVLTEVDHIDGDKKNNHWTNLQWIEHDSNVRKSSAYLYTMWHVQKPDEKYLFTSRRLACQFLQKQTGSEKEPNLTYASRHRKGLPNRYGWCIDSRKLTVEERFNYNGYGTGYNGK